MMWTPAHFTDQEANYRLHLTSPQLVLSGLVLKVYRKKKIILSFEKTQVPLKTHDHLRHPTTPQTITDKLTEKQSSTILNNSLGHLSDTRMLNGNI